MGRPFLWLSLLWLASDLKLPSMGTASSSGKAKLKRLTHGGEKSQIVVCSSLSSWWQNCWWLDAGKGRPYHSSLWEGKGRTGVFERGTLEPTVLLNVGDALWYAVRKALLQVGTGLLVYGVKGLGTGGLALPSVPASMVCEWCYLERWRNQWGNAKWKRVSSSA